jgi:hypothetical protein
LAGWAAFAGALGALFVALRIIPLHRDRGVDFIFYSGLGVALLFLGGELATARPFRGLLWAALALVAALIGRRLQPVALWVYSATLAWGAALSAGVLALMRDGLLGSAADSWAPLQASLLIVVGLVGTTWFATALKLAPSTGPDVVERLPAGALLLLAAVSAAALINYSAHVLLGGQQADSGLLATGRTLSIVAVAAGLALLQRTIAQPELGWIAYAMLALGAIKLVVEDLPHGRAITLLVAFAVYGGALIAVPKLVARRVSHE